MRILFITATRIGDAVLSTGLLDHLLHRYPEATFTIACGPAAEGVFVRMPRLERLILVEKRRFDSHWPRLWWQVAAGRWSLIVDLRGSALSFTMPAGRRAVMRGGRRPGHRLTHLAGTLNLDPPPMPVTWTAPEDRALAASLIPPGVPVIGLGPTANWAGKIWPPERFVALFQTLAAGALPGARAAIFAGPGEMEAAAASTVINALPGVIDLVGRLSLPQVAACLARTRLFIGNDSGLMHLAAAAGAPTLGLFGPTPASEYGPAGRCTGVAQADPSGALAPIDRLEMETALAAALALLDRNTAAAAEAA